MKVALVLCPVWSREMPHIALAMLSSFLRRDGHEVSIFDLNNEFHHCVAEEHKDKWKKENDTVWTDRNFVSRFILENEKLITLSLEKILATDAKIIGFSVYYPNELMSLELARRIKGIDRSRVIVFGGSQCLREHRGWDIIKEDVVDIVVSGEGEETLLDSIRSIERYGKVKSCEGALFKINGDIIDGGDRLPINALDNLPFLDFTDFDLSRYEYNNALPVLSSRGCVQDCVYCTVNMYWKRYRSFSGNRLFQEIQHQVKQFSKVREFHFYDPLLNGNIKTLESFCDLVISHNKEKTLPSITWQGEAVVRSDTDMDLLRKMKQAGCYHLAYGIESGSQKVINKMNKKMMKINDAERIIRQTHESGVTVALNFMFGFPTETVKDFNESLEFIKKNHRYIDCIIPSDSFCTITKGTYLYNHPEEFDVLLSPYPEYWESLDRENNYLERLRRFESFCELALSLHIKLGTGYNKVKTFREERLKEYFSHQDRNADRKLSIAEKQGSELSKKRSQIGFSWDLHYNCNYRCPYCWFHGNWEGLKKMNRYFSVDEWAQRWKRIYDEHGSVHIDILGGEPFIYPNFVELVRKMSSLHELAITTNLSVDIEDFVREVDASNVTVNPTFHPLFGEIDTFIKKACILKEKGFSGGATYLAYPPQINRLQEYRERFEDSGLSFCVMTYWGEYKGVSYPDGYTEEERNVIGGSLSSREGEKFQIVPKKVKGSLCHAGHRYALIQGNGNVLRCGGGKSNEFIGNFFDENFGLLNGPLPCNAEFCRCNEWAFLLEK